jgi:hypothetical protein
MFGEELERPPEIYPFRRDRGPSIFLGHRERLHHQVVDRFLLILIREQHLQLAVLPSEKLQNLGFSSEGSCIVATATGAGFPLSARANAIFLQSLVAGSSTSPADPSTVDESGSGSISGRSPWSASISESIWRFFSRSTTSFLSRSVSPVFGNGLRVHFLLLPTLRGILIGLFRPRQYRTINRCWIMEEGECS